MPSELAPSLLVAMSVIVDPNFRRSVVLMLEHDPEQGALGLVVNRASDFPMERLCADLGLDWRGDAEHLVDWGGPVQQETGWVLLGDEGAAEVDAVALHPGIHWSRSRDALALVAARPALRSRIFLGYAGWGAGQLEREIAEGSWLVVPVTPSLVFECEKDALWEHAVRSLGIEPATLVPSQGVN